MREICTRCRWPVNHCWCSMLPPMDSKTKFVLLMHPHELKKVKANTGRFTALSFKDAEILVGVSFDDCVRLNELLDDPTYFPVLLYPRAGAKNISEGSLQAQDLSGRRLLVILVDATWTLAKKMVKLSPILHGLPSIMFTPTSPSQWIIKRQPHELCLSTLEAVHELMLALEKAGLDYYEKPEQLPVVFRALNEFQVACANDPAKHTYERAGGAKPNTEAGRVRVRKGKKARNIFWRL